MTLVNLDAEMIDCPEEGILGYKVFNSNLTCRGFQYEIGKTYEIEGPLQICSNGFHFCEKLEDCFSYYSIYDSRGKRSRVCQVRAYGKIQKHGDKWATSKIEIVKEILDNRGCYNTGAWNSGVSNNGTLNIGRCNNGYLNKGASNDGNYNKGEDNFGSTNIGRKNFGANNKGTYNCGRGNVGDSNVGTGNVGNNNIGIGNVGDNLFGMFNTEATPIYIFNKPYAGSYAKLSATFENEIFVLCYLIARRAIIDREPERQDGFPIPNPLALKNLSRLPNFDTDVFLELTGIDYEAVTSSLSENEKTSGYIDTDMAGDKND